MADMRGGSTDDEYNDPDYYESLRANGAAGVFFMCTATRRIMLAHRSEWVETPFHWSGFGGAIGHGETPEQAVRREIVEESGYHGVYDLVPVYRFSSPTFTYQNYVAFVEHEFAAKLQWENTDAEWFDLNDLPSPLHPGMAMCLQDELTKRVLREHFGLNEDIAELTHNPREIDPALLTFSEYRDVIDAQHKSHPSKAYDVGLAQLNDFFKLEDYRRVLRRVRVNNLAFTIRLQIDEAKYTKSRDANGVIYFTDEERAALGYPRYNYSIAVVDEENQCVASLQDEWGCVLVMVAREYRGFGFGAMLVELAYTIEPAKPSGGFTESGFRTFRKVYREFVGQALRAGRYRQLIQDGVLTMSRVKEIIASANLENRSKAPAKRDLANRDPRDWLLYGTDTTFILYDRKLREHTDDEHWGDQMLKAMIHFGIIERSDRHYGIIYTFGGEKPTIKTLMLRCAAHVCEQDNAVLMVDPEDEALIDSKFLTAGETNMDTGYQRIEVRLAVPFDPTAMTEHEAEWRQSFDQYDEFFNTLLERADSKYRHVNINEVEDESHYPINDELGNKGIDKAHEVDQQVGERLVVLASKGPFTIRATTTRPANNRAYIFDGETPIGVFDIFTRERDGMKCISTPYSYLRPEYRRQGLGYWFYTHFLDQGIPLASGKTHTTDSKALWQKLADNYRVTVGGEQIVGDIQKYYGTKSPFIAHPNNS